jgi:hypothetical protein
MCGIVRVAVFGRPRPIPSTEASGDGAGILVYAEAKHGRTERNL